MVRKGSKTVIAGKCLLKGHPAFLTSKVHGFWRSCWTVDTWACSSQAHYCLMQQRVTQSAANPVKCLTVGLVIFQCQHWCNSFIDHTGCWSHSSCCGKKKKKAGEKDLCSTSLTCWYFIDSVWRNAQFHSPPQKSSAVISRRAPSLLADCRVSCSPESGLS